MIRIFADKLLWCLALLAVFGCATSPRGRKQLMLVGDDQMAQMGIQAFEQTKQQTPVSNDPAVNAYVQCVAAPIIQAVGDKVKVDRWEVVVFNSPQVNAFALPGGRIGVYSGLLNVANTDAQLAAVIGHEVGHVVSKHGAERVSQGLLEELGLTAAEIATQGNPHQGALMAALGLGTQVGIQLPFSRTQEAEADLVGLDLMAQAGFDPAAAVQLWKNMAQATQGQHPPEFLSDHPSDQARIESIQKTQEEAQRYYQQAKAAGKNPHCPPPSITPPVPQK